MQTRTLSTTAGKAGMLISGGEVWLTQSLSGPALTGTSQLLHRAQDNVICSADSWIATSLVLPTDANLTSWLVSGELALQCMRAAVTGYCFEPDSHWKQKTPIGLNSESMS